MTYWCLLQTYQELRGYQRNATFEKLQVKFFGLLSIHYLLEVMTSLFTRVQTLLKLFSVSKLCKKKSCNRK